MRNPSPQALHCMPQFRISTDRAELDELCEKLLVNPLIEDYIIELDETE